MTDVTDQQDQGLDPYLQSVLAHASAATGHLIYCASCSYVIARKADGCTINGRHSHRCVNPHGIRFHVGCYRDALGCAIAGQPTAADSWFPGFVWRLAACAECRTHLGWYFERHGEYFYGLIIDRIQED